MPQPASDSAEIPQSTAIKGSLPDNVLPLPVFAQRRQADAQPSVGRATAMPTRSLQPLGQILLEDGAISPDLLLKATVLRNRQNVRLGEILLAHGWVSESDLTRALSRQWRTNTVNLVKTPPDPRLIDMAGAEFCLNHAIVPWRKTGGLTWIATARPEAFADLVKDLPAAFGTVRMLLCSEIHAQEAILATRRTRLIRAAETRVPAPESCRNRDQARAARLAAGALIILLAGMVLAPIMMVSLLAGWAILTLLTATMFKLLCFRAALANTKEERISRANLAAGQTAPPQMTEMLPLISMMVPLFAESDIADKLVARLERLTYPRELTDILLVVEESDHITRTALANTGLPRWIRVVTVPDGPIRTKPRALNYALNFCRGDIVGVWDAEDRPEPDQLHKVARRFHFAPKDVACLQGKLDFYNPRTNWLARCFTVEYATWFRAILPGVARMGLVVPLGGTTLFFRRDALEQVGAWDAWNVTEDADLGVRLARRGFRTEIVDTTTDEEANCRYLPWIKQRSRWLKGYAMTWGVHMRNPRQLWSELGPKRFIGFQVQFLGTLSQYVLAPVLLSFWLVTLGMPDPLAARLGAVWSSHAYTAIFVLFVAAELVNIAIGLWAVRGAKHRHLRPWVPSLHLYHPLGCLAGWKAIYEVVVKPFYWDKTAHGLFDATQQTAANPNIAPLDQRTDLAAFLPGSQRIPLLGQLQLGDTRLREVATVANGLLKAGVGATALAGEIEEKRDAGQDDRETALKVGSIPGCDTTEDGASHGPILQLVATTATPRHLQLSFMRRRQSMG